jgi:hypothetical protein
VTRQAGAAIAGVTAAAALLAWLLFTALPRSSDGSATNASIITSPADPGLPSRKIKARLFYLSEDGTRLSAVERDVPYGEGAEQAREIVAAQIAPVAEPLVSAVPPGTRLRGVFITEHGEAYVDLSREAVAAHPGGTLNELLTVYTFVNALTANLPAVHSVQLLVEGSEVPTLAGHVDLGRPLVRNLEWIQ